MFSTFSLCKIIVYGIVFVTFSEMEALNVAHGRAGDGGGGGGGGGSSPRASSFKLY